MLKFKSVHTAPILCLAIFLLLSLISLLKPEQIGVESLLTELVLRILIFLIPGFLYCRLKGSDYRHGIGIKPFSPSAIPLIIFSALFMLCASLLIRYLTSPVASGGVVSGSGEAPLYYSVVVSCLLPALLEEFIFRGIMIREYRPLGAMGAVIFSSALFAMLHFSVAYFPVYFFAGIVLGLVFLLTGSVFASVSVHFLYNLMMLLSEHYLWDVITKAEYRIMFIFIFICLMLLFLFFSLGSAENTLRRNAELIPEEKNYVYPKGEEKIRNVFLSLITPGFLACAAYFVIAAIVLLQSSGG